MSKYSYLYKFIKSVPKANIASGDEMFFDKSKGDILVKKGYAKFVGKFKLANGKFGTILETIKQPQTTKRKVKK